jgi:hypothetical protein
MTTLKSALLWSFASLGALILNFTVAAQNWASILNFTVAAQNWASVGGITAQDIAVGSNGTVWATGTNSVIYRLNGSTWQAIPGEAARIAVDPRGDAWAVNSGNEIFRYVAARNNWVKVTGNATDIGIGADGSVWIIGANRTQGGFDIYKWNGNGWNLVPGGAVRIAVDPKGNAWVVNNTNNVFRFSGSTFVQLPGSVRDIGIGANGAIWCTTPSDQIYQWNGSDWTLKTGAARNISVAPDGNAWVANSGGEVFRTTDAATTAATTSTLEIKTLFPRGQTAEYRMLQALKISPYTNTVPLNGPPSLASIEPLGQALGSLGLVAAEIYASHHNLGLNGDQLLGQISNNVTIRSNVSGILGFLVMAKVSERASDRASIALQRWASDLFYSIKVRNAKAILDQYERWAADPCTYRADGYEKPIDCNLGQSIADWFRKHSPPQDVLAKAGMKSVLPSNADAYASGMSVALAGATIGVAYVSVLSGLGIVKATFVTSTGVVSSVTALSGAFGGSTGAAGASGAIGGLSWAGVVAAPVAAAIMVAVVGTMEGFRVVEAEKVGPMLKMRLGAAMTDPINIANVMADENTASLFFMAFTESAQRGFTIPPVNVDGEVRFYCQAGYVSRFNLSYTLNGQTVTRTTRELPVGHEESFAIPFNATNIRVNGSYAAGTWKEFFNTSLSRPTYICYTSYGTVFDAQVKNDCPEVGNMTTQANQLTVTHGGGYVAWVKLTYTLNGRTVTPRDQQGLTLGWREVFDIPSGASNIKLEIWCDIARIGNPWEKFVDRTWPQPPNECVKVFGTIFDRKFNNECK